jgi:hypothetical protein
MNREFEKRLANQQEELYKKFEEEKENILIIEREKFDSKIDSIKGQFKAEFERLLKVFDFLIFILNITFQY